MSTWQDWGYDDQNCQLGKTLNLHRPKPLYMPVRIVQIILMEVGTLTINIDDNFPFSGGPNSRMRLKLSET